MSFKSSTKTVSTIQIFISLLMLSLLSFMGVQLYEKQNIEFILREILPRLVLVLCALIPSIILRVKHKAEAIEGALIPLSLLFITLEALSIVNPYSNLTGAVIISYSVSIKLLRLIYLTTALTFLFAGAVSLQPEVLSKINIYLTLGFIACLSISLSIPVNTMQSLSNYHSSFFTALVLIILLLANLTYFINFIKEKDVYSVYRFFTCLFLSTGQFMILIYDKSEITTIVGIVFCIIGSLLLCIVNPDNY